MAKKAQSAGRARASRGRRIESHYSAAEFKARCLELMDRVRESRVEYVVTKHGRPVARLVPFTESHKTTFFGSLKGSVLKYERPFDPIDGQYDIDRD
ncbi:MAG TPA: type II toxin-antitoxin system prevent-host-death family antitoxin [Vicinamibacterales bacterium]|jgi:prevent-host-death family protein